MDFVTLKILLSDWTDVDICQHELAKLFGIIERDKTFIETKCLYWSNNTVGNQLKLILDYLVELSILEMRDEPDFQYRWNSGRTFLD